MSEYQPSPATIWKFQIVRYATINRLLTESAPEKRLYSGNCGFAAPTIRFPKYFHQIFVFLRKRKLKSYDEVLSR